MIFVKNYLGISHFKEFKPKNDEICFPLKVIPSISNQSSQQSFLI